MKNFFYYHTSQSPHLKENKMTYLEHLKFSMSLSGKFAKGFFCGFIHSFLPNCFETSSSDISNEIANTIIQRKIVQRDL